jgi:hypothetical protein
MSTWSTPICLRNRRSLSSLLRSHAEEILGPDPDLGFGSHGRRRCVDSVECPGARPGTRGRQLQRHGGDQSRAGSAKWRRSWEAPSSSRSSIDQKSSSIGLPVPTMLTGVPRRPASAGREGFPPGRVARTSCGVTGRSWMSPPRGSLEPTICPPSNPHPEQDPRSSWINGHDQHGH